MSDEENPLDLEFYGPPHPAPPPPEPPAAMLDDRIIFSHPPRDAPPLSPTLMLDETQSIPATFPLPPMSDDPGPMYY